MYEIRRWVGIFRWALEKAYQMEAGKAFMQFSKRQTKKTDNCLIKNMDAYEVAEAMKSGLLEQAFLAAERLREL
jgi:hypothetical protein